MTSMASLSSKASLRTTRVVSERLTLALTLTINIASSSSPSLSKPTSPLLLGYANTTS